MDLIQQIKEKLPVVESDINYWLVRTNAGDYYNEFVSEGFIGIGWNKITLDYLTENYLLENVIRENYPKESRPGYAGKQIIRFAKEIKKGDIVLIPSKNSKYIECGYVESDEAYEADIPFEAEDPDSLEYYELETEGSSPYRKRKKVKWIKPLIRSRLDPKLYLLLYSHHTITSANEYKDLINRAMYDMYIQDDKCYATFHVDREDNIDAKTLANLINDFLYINNMENEERQDSLELKISVQSPGVAEIIDNFQNIIWTCIVIYSIIGGRFKFFSLMEVETRGVAGVVYDFMKMKQEDRGEIEKEVKDRVENSAENLDIKQPTELKKAVDEVQREEEKSKKENQNN